MWFLTSLGVDPGVLLAQIINLLILFFAFKFFVGKKLHKAITERRSLMNKLDQADKEYNKMIENAQTEADKIFADAEKQKQQLIAEGKQVGEKYSTQKIDEAQREAQVLIENAKQKTEKMQNDLNKNFEESVKQTTFSVVKKLIKSQPQIEEQYISDLVKEVEKK